MIDLKLIYTNEAKINSVRASEFSEYSKHYSSGNEIEKKMGELYESLSNNYNRIASHYTVLTNGQQIQKPLVNLSEIYQSLSITNGQLGVIFTNALLNDPANLWINHFKNYHCQASDNYLKVSDNFKIYK